MRDRVLIFSGLFLFLALFTYPVWHGIAARTSTREPELKLPANQTFCVAPLDYMRTTHMQLLIQWRDAAVREHQLRYAAYNGKSYKIGLTSTCLDQCHGSKKQFCDQCHQYAGVPTPYCWDCHQDASPSAANAPLASVAGRHP